MDLNKDRLRTAYDEVVAKIDAKRNGLLSVMLYKQMQELVFETAYATFARHCLTSNSTPYACRLRLTTPTPKTERAHCMTCGRGLDPEKVAVGGRARFYSACCMDAYDAGWPVYGTTIADYMTRPVVTPVPGLTR
jgi:hypothetical protein